MSLSLVTTSAILVFYKESDVKKINQVCMIVMTLSFAAIALVQTGVIKPAHAISLNAAMRQIIEEVQASEERLDASIKDVCAE